MIAPFSSAGIILTYQCNSTCRHCLYNCSPSFSDWASKEWVDNLFARLKATTPRMRGYHLAGGEAFLNFPLLLEAVRSATNHGIPIDYVETNAGWFRDETDAVSKLMLLKEAGLDCLLVSASPFHAEHIPIYRTIGLVHASIKVFGSSGTIVWLPEFLRKLSINFDQAKTISLEEYLEKTGTASHDYTWQYGGALIAGGRASDTLDDRLPQKPLEELYQSTCRMELYVSGGGHIDLYGNMIPACCSGLSLGNADDLESVYKGETLSDRPLLRLLADTGVRGLVELAMDQCGFQPKKSYSSKCALCYQARKSLMPLAQAFPELAPACFYAAA